MMDGWMDGWTREIRKNNQRFLGLEGLLYGPGILFSPEISPPPPLTDTKDFRFGSAEWRTTFVREDEEKDKKANLMNSYEALFCQWLTYHVHDRESEVLYSFNSFISGCGQVIFGPDRRSAIDCTLVLKDGRGGVVIEFSNFHGAFWHEGSHLPRCRKYADNANSRDVSLDHEFCEREFAYHAEISDSETLEKRKLTAFKDEFNERYAEAMNMVRDNLEVRYKVFHECDLFCPSSVTSLRSGKKFGNIRQLLREEHRDESVLGLNTKKMKLSDILRKLTAEEEDNVRNGSDHAGFLTVSGGLETAQDNSSAVGFGFCLQRDYPDPEKLGDYTTFLSAKRRSEGSSEQSLEKRCSKLQTLCKRSFHDRGETVEASYLRFLVKKRKLQNYTSLHHVFYRKKKYLSKYIDNLLQARHEFKKKGETLAEQSLKLILNSYYGYCSLESTNHPKTTINVDNTLRRKWSKLQEEGLFRITFIGCVKAVGVKKSSVIYALTTHNRNAQILNLLQVSACILSKSKECFFEKIMTMLNVFRPDSCCLAYIDTDGVVLGSYSANLRDILEDSYIACADAIFRDLFEDSESSRHQAGKFKMEASCFIIEFPKHDKELNFCTSLSIREFGRLDIFVA
jgi:hypothetical protein